jgi:TonB family protein
MKSFGTSDKAAVSAAPGSRRSAEQLIVFALIGVCVVAGGGIWLANRGGDRSETAAALPAVVDTASIPSVADAPASNWQGQLEGEKDKIDRARAQEQRSVEAETQAQQQRDRERQDLDRRQRELSAQAAALAAAAKSTRVAPDANAAAAGGKSGAAAAAASSDELIPARLVSDSCQPPEYPAAAERQQQEGQVVLGFQVDTQGRVLDQRIDKSSGYGTLDNAAARALGRCRFTPTMRNGVAETAWTQVRFTWKITR